MKLLFVTLVLVSALASHTSLAQLPETYLVSPAIAVAAKKRVAPDTLKRFTKQADAYLSKRYGSVMEKNVAPPCGNMHEYMSMARYWWPDTSKPGGVPYIRKDGEKNPANDLVTDDRNFDELIKAVHQLSWAYYFSNDEKYATKGIALLRFWFLDTATRMMPNMNHAQIRTGIDSGVYTGIIDSHNLPQVVDGIGLLRTSVSWQASDEAGMKQWFSDYLTWLTESVNGKKEAEMTNNHGTFYEAQAMIIAMYTGNKEISERLLVKVKSRLQNQIQPDGKQPLELERTLALSYSSFNLQAWSAIANASERAGVDIWHYTTADGRSLKGAIDYLLPYIAEGKKWEYQQIHRYDPQDFYPLLVLAAGKMNEPRYKAAAAKLHADGKNLLAKLLYAE